MSPEGLFGRGVGAVGACALAMAIACGGSGKGAEEAGKGKGGGEVTAPPAGDDDDGGGGGNGGNGGEVGDNGGGNLNAIPADKGGGGPGPGEGKPAPAPVASPALKTSESPVKMSEALVKPARDAEKKKNWALAVTYYQALVEARGPASAEAAELAMRWVDAGEFKRAADVYAAFIDSTTDPKEREAKLAIYKNLMAGPARNPFSKDFVQRYATADAFKLFKLGQNAFKTKRYADAELYYRMGGRLDPTLPGFLRELGATYDKLGIRDKKISFYRRYLARSPFGANADFARGELAKEKGALGKLSMKSALPCDGGIWLNEQKLPPKMGMPVRNLPMPPGLHTALCWNIGYEIAHFERDFEVEAGKTTDITFNWAVVVNKLENPHGRIWLEDVTDPRRELRQLLLKNGGIGVPVPADGRPMRYRLQSMDRTVTKDNLLIRIAPGTVEHIKWP